MENKARKEGIVVMVNLRQQQQQVRKGVKDSVSKILMELLSDTMD